MRFLFKITPDAATFNACVKDGTAPQKMQTILSETKPEAAYFGETGGKRTVFLIVNMDEASQLPPLAEPWFLVFNSTIEMHPVMLGEDLAKGNLDELGRKWK